MTAGQQEAARSAPAPRVSIIVVTYNSAKWARDCFRALLAQDYSGGFEVVVRDNGSTDDTVAILGREFPSVRVVRGDNVGFAAGNNSAARATSGGILAFVNPDTVAEPDWLRELVRPIEARHATGDATGGAAGDATQAAAGDAAVGGPGDAAGGASGGAAIGATTGQPIGADVTTSSVTLLGQLGRLNTCGLDLHFTGIGFVRGFGRPTSEHAVDREVQGLSGAAFAMRADDFWRIGGFDEDFFLYNDDIDLSWRARRAGLRIVHAARSRVAHSYTFRLDPFKFYHFERGRHLLLRKHYRWFHWLLLWPSLLVTGALMWAWALRLGWAGVKAKSRAFRDALRTPTRRVAETAGLPPLRLSQLSTWHGKWGGLNAGFLVRAAGTLANAVYALNTVGWLLARRRAPASDPKASAEIPGVPSVRGKEAGR